MCVFLLVLGALLVIRVWLPPTFDGIDPEQYISKRHRSRMTHQPPIDQGLTQDYIPHHHVTVDN